RPCGPSKSGLTEPASDSKVHWARFRRISFSLTSNETRSPGPSPSASRTSAGIVTRPFESREQSIRELPSLPLIRNLLRNFTLSSDFNSDGIHHSSYVYERLIRLPRVQISNASKPIPTPDSATARA